jgi:hypothetical protein
MSTLSIVPSLALRSCELMKLYSLKAGAFQIEEYNDCGAVYKRLREAAESKDETVEVSEIDLKYVISAIAICSSRIAIEVQNYKPIASLLEELSAAVKSEDLEETKTEL